MKVLFSLLIGIGVFFATPAVAFAATNNLVDQFTNQTIAGFIAIASLASVFFLIKGGIRYMTSTGKPEELAQAKLTIRNALIGLVLVVGAGVFSSILQTAFTQPATPGSTQTFELEPIEPVEPAEGLTRVLLEAVTGFLQTIIQSATKPIIDGIISLLTMTPSFVTNSVVFNLWLVMVGIVDSLFVLLIAVLGFQFMSASTFGFDELSLRQLLPRIGLAFLAANMSLFAIDWVLALSNILIQAILASTGGITEAWVLNAFDPRVLLPDGRGTATITLIFMLLFIILAVVLLLFYITRLITLSVGAVLSPFIFLLWLLPGFRDFALVAMRSYLVLIFIVFIHVVIIQLASAFLTIPGQSGTNSIISILVGVATFFTLLKTHGTIMQFAFYSATGSAFRKLGGQMTHVISSQKNADTRINRRKNDTQEECCLMRTTIVPAQITTVEDRITGNLTLTQIVLLLAPVFLGGFLYLIFPPQLDFALYKLAIIAGIFSITGSLAVRVREKIVLQWLGILIRYRLRPRYTIFDKNDNYLRNVLSEVPATQTVRKTLIRPSEKTASRQLLPLAQLTKLEHFLRDPQANVRFTFTKKGGMHVSFAKVQ